MNEQLNGHISQSHMPHPSRTLPHPSLFERIWNWLARRALPDDALQDFRFDDETALNTLSPQRRLPPQQPIIDLRTQPSVGPSAK